MRTRKERRERQERLMAVSREEALEAEGPLSQEVEEPDIGSGQ